MSFDENFAATAAAVLAVVFAATVVVIAVVSTVLFGLIALVLLKGPLAGRLSD